MNRGLSLLALALLLAPGALAQGDSDVYHIENLRATAGNQFIELTWDPVPASDVAGYAVWIYADGELYRRPDNRTAATYSDYGYTNDQTYVFQVAAIRGDGTTGPLSAPVSATPTSGRNLPYLAAGMIAVWLGLFGYALFLARKESQLEKRLEQLQVAKYEGKLP